MKKRLLTIAIALAVLPAIGGLECFSSGGPQKLPDPEPYVCGGGDGCGAPDETVPAGGRG